MSISSQVLVEALRAVVSAVERRPQSPALGHTLLRFRSGELEVVGRNSEYQLRTSVTVEGEASWEAAVPARKFLDLLSKFPSEMPLEIALEEGYLSIRTDRGRYRLAMLSGEDFPLLELSEIEAEIGVPTPAFHKLLSHVLYCMAQNDVRLSLNGFLLEVVGNELRAVASDGHRLALGVLRIEEATLEGMRLVVPRQAAFELYRKFKGQGEVCLKLGKRSLVVLTEETELTTLLIDAPFPDYRLAFPKEVQLFLQVSRGELLGALSRIMAITPEEGGGVRLKMVDGALVVESHAAETGDEGEERLPAKIEGKPFEVVFNPHYLREALNHLDGEEVRLQLSSPLGACLIEDGSPFQHVVMPMRL